MKLFWREGESRQRRDSRKEAIAYTITAQNAVVYIGKVKDSQRALCHTIHVRMSRMTRVILDGYHPAVQKRWGKERTFGDENSKDVHP